MRKKPQDAKDIIAELLELQERYSFVKRNLVTADRYEQIALKGLVDPTDYTNEVLREPLLEHIGHLPVLATYLHPYIENSKNVNLGRVLTMLAIHDIGETVVGDVFTYNKTDSEETDEYEAALKIIDDSLTPIFKEYEERKTLDSLYAKSIDALAPIVNSMYRPGVKLAHFKLLGASVQDVVDRKANYFEWDKVMKEVFDTCIVHFQAIERGENGYFTRKDM